MTACEPLRVLSACVQGEGCAFASEHELRFGEALPPITLLLEDAFGNQIALPEDPSDISQALEVLAVFPSEGLNFLTLRLWRVL